jgi:hypothetical protein
MKGRAGNCTAGISRMGILLWLGMALIILAPVPNAFAQHVESGAASKSIEITPTRGAASQTQKASPNAPLSREQCKSFLASWKNADPTLQKLLTHTKTKCENLLR